MSWQLLLLTINVTTYYQTKPMIAIIWVFLIVIIADDHENHIVYKTVMNTKKTNNIFVNSYRHEMEAAFSYNNHCSPRLLRTESHNDSNQLSLNKNKQIGLIIITPTFHVYLCMEYLPTFTFGRFYR